VVEERLPGEPANKGWNRASIMFWSRKAYRPRIRREDFRPLKHVRGPRLLGTCVAGAIGISAFFVWVPLFFVSIFSGLSMTAFAAIIGSAFVLLTCVLYAWLARGGR
jgi:hypothetical protein